MEVVVDLLVLVVVVAVVVEQNPQDLSHFPAN